MFYSNDVTAVNMNCLCHFLRYSVKGGFVSVEAPMHCGSFGPLLLENFVYFKSK
jgi:hypothetical protein